MPVFSCWVWIFQGVICFPVIVSHWGVFFPRILEDCRSNETRLLLYCTQWMCPCVVLLRLSQQSKLLLRETVWNCQQFAGTSPQISEFSSEFWLQSHLREILVYFVKEAYKNLSHLRDTSDTTPSSVTKIILLYFHSNGWTIQWSRAGLGGICWLMAQGGRMTFSCMSGKKLTNKHMSDIYYCHTSNENNIDGCIRTCWFGLSTRCAVQNMLKSSHVPCVYSSMAQNSSYLMASICFFLLFM